MYGILKVNSINLALFLLGGLITTASYLSAAPIIVAVVFFSAAQLLLLTTALGGLAERRIFNRVFCVGFVASGIAAIYANQLKDPFQLLSDAGDFFEIAAATSQNPRSLIELQLVNEGALAIILWSTVYDLFSTLGFPRERYIGILLNVTAVALSGVVALKITRLVFGNDPERFRLLTTLFASCGLFWLFAAIHLRDSVVLLTVTSLVYGWLLFLTKPDVGRQLLQITALSFLTGLIFNFLRGEFVFVPIAAIVAGTAALMFGLKSRRYRLVPYVMALLGIVVGGALLAVFGDSIQSALTGGNEGYSKLAAEQHGAQSLGMTLIANQPMPIRLPLGSVYLFVFPIPFWTGFQLESVYTLFKSFNVIFFYFLLPLLVLSLRELWRSINKLTPAILFLFFVSLGFTLAIAWTSLETRHFGAFLVPIFVLALVPDLRLATTRRAYKHLLVVVIISMAVIHLAWIILKL